MKQVKVTLRLNEPDYEYLRHMAESKFDYGGLNLIIREVLHTFVENTKKIVAQKQAENTENIKNVATSSSLIAAE